MPTLYSNFTELVLETSHLNKARPIYFSDFYLLERAYLLDTSVFLVPVQGCPTYSTQTDDMLSAAEHLYHDGF